MQLSYYLTVSFWQAESASQSESMSDHASHALPPAEPSLAQPVLKLATPSCNLPSQEPSLALSSSVPSQHSAASVNDRFTSFCSIFRVSRAFLIVKLTIRVNISFDFTQLWTCESCTYVNSAGCHVCQICDKPLSPVFLSPTLQPPPQVHQLKIAELP